MNALDQRTDFYKDALRAEVEQAMQEQDRSVSLEQLRANLAQMSPEAVLQIRDLIAQLGGVDGARRYLAELETDGESQAA